MASNKAINALKNILNSRLNFIVVFANDFVRIITIAIKGIVVPRIGFLYYRIVSVLHLELSYKDHDRIPIYILVEGCEVKYYTRSRLFS